MKIKHTLVASCLAALSLTFGPGLLAQEAQGRVNVDTDIDKDRSVDIDAKTEVDVDRKVDVDVKTDRSDRSTTAGVRSSKVKDTNKATSLLGMEVFNPQGEMLGDINDIVLDLQSGKVSYAVLAAGGFLGIGEKWIAIPPSALSYDEAKGRLILNADKAKLQGAPGFAKTNWPDPNNPSWGAGFWTGSRDGASDDIKAGVRTDVNIDKSSSDDIKAGVRTDLDTDKSDPSYRDADRKNLNLNQQNEDLNAPYKTSSAPYKSTTDMSNVRFEGKVDADSDADKDSRLRSTQDNARIEGKFNADSDVETEYRDSLRDRLTQDRTIRRDFTFRNAEADLDRSQARVDADLDMDSDLQRSQARVDADMDLDVDSDVDFDAERHIQAARSNDSKDDADLQADVDLDMDNHPDRSLGGAAQIRTGQGASSDDQGSVFRGRIVSVNPEERTMTVQGDEGARTFQFAQRPAIQIDRKPVSYLVDLKSGYTVVVGYHSNGDDYVAHTVTKADPTAHK